jgi:hypothetical protein
MVKKMQIELRNIGLDLAAFGSFVSILGVILNNVFLMHREAMIIWCGSNIVLAIYFYGLSKDYWEGGLSAKIICGTYVFSLVSGVWGLMR